MLCKKCNKEKNGTHISYCRDCYNSYKRNWYLKNREKEIKRCSDYNKKHPEVPAKSMAKCRAKRPDHYRHQNRLNYHKHKKLLTKEQRKQLNILVGLKSRIHGESIGKRTKEYRIWRSLKDRCLNKNNKDYRIYGGRGIKVCDEWENSFINFLKDMGRCPENKYSIDRINNNGDYEPSNCRWADYKEQANNKGGYKLK